jgi:hypothetical protein
MLDGFRLWITRSSLGEVLTAKHTYAGRNEPVTIGEQQTRGSASKPARKRPKCSTENRHGGCTKLGADRCADRSRGCCRGCLRGCRT